MNVLIKTFFFVFLILGTIYASRSPRHNWDMIPYMACVIEKTTPSSEACHAKTYAILHQELGDEKYNKLSYNGYTATMESNHEAFSENLPYYTIRIVYVSIVNFFYQLGVPLSFSTVLPSLISVFLIVLILFFVLSKELNNRLLASVIPLIILYFPPMIHLARLSTPDALSALFILLVAVLYLYRSNWVLIFLFMAFSITIRTDNVIWCLLLLLFEGINSFEKKKIWLLVSFMLGLVSIYLIINSLHSNGGWEVLFYSAFIERLSFPLSQTPSLGVDDYLMAIAKRIPDFLPSFLAIFIGLVCLKNKNIKTVLESRGARILFVGIVSFLAKFVLFPSFNSRFHFVLILILVVTLAIEWKNLIKLYVPISDLENE